MKLHPLHDAPCSQLPADEPVCGWSYQEYAIYLRTLSVGLITTCMFGGSD